jgi:DNA repair exonuclease SbcCD ATPase subunit
LQGEAAESELQKLLGFTRPRRDAEPGIWGTLWVQQGQSFSATNLDPSGRRSIESCLKAQVGVVTGGHRGQRIPVVVDEALLEIQTKATRAPRGKFKDARDKLAQARAEIEDLKIKKNRIFDEMDELARLRRDRQCALADWDEPEHQRQLKDLHDCHTAAATKAEHIDAARKAAELAAERARRAQEEANDREELIDNITSLEPQVETAREQLERAECCKAELQKQINELEQQLDALRQLERKNREETRRLDRIHSVLELDTELRQHKDTLAKAAQLPGEITRLIEQLAANPATDENVSRVEDASSDLAAARAAARAVATVLTFVLEPGAGSLVRLDGKLVETAHVTTEAITERTMISINGIGEITIEPKNADRDAIIESVRRAEAELGEALERVGAKDLAAARRAKAERQVLAGQLASKQREIRELAPADPSRKLAAGLEAREARIAELQGKLNGETERLGLASLPAWAEIEEQFPRRVVRRTKFHDVLGRLLPRSAGRKRRWRRRTRRS